MHIKRVSLDIYHRTLHKLQLILHSSVYGSIFTNFIVVVEHVVQKYMTYELRLNETLNT